LSKGLFFTACTAPLTAFCTASIMLPVY
jgi:hypothetical protein